MIAFILSYILPITLGIILIELLRPKLCMLAARWLYKHHAQQRKEVEEDIIKLLYHRQCDEVRTDIHSLGMEVYMRHYLLGDIRLDSHLLTDIIAILHKRGFIQIADLTLTTTGQEMALGIIRRHRLYEKYLAEYSGYTADEWHKKAERMEHKLSRKDERRIARLLGHPIFDPHGDPIPAEGGGMHVPDAIPLASIDTFPICVRIIHIEDEPTEIYRSIAARHLYPSAVIELRGLTDSGGLIYVLDGDPEDLSPAEIASISIVIEESKRADITNGFSVLSALKRGQSAVVCGISPACRGAARRRLLDLGFVSGSRISIDLESPLGNPTAYLVRGTAIALRKDQAQYIKVKEIHTNKNAV